MREKTVRCWRTFAYKLREVDKEHGRHDRLNWRCGDRDLIPAARTSSSMRRLLLPTACESQRDRLRHSLRGESFCHMCGRAPEAGIAMMAIGEARATRSTLHGHAATARSC